MAKYYVTSGDMQGEVDAPDPVEAVLRCIKNHIGEHGSIQLGRIATVNEQGFSEESRYGDDGHIVMIENIIHRLGPGYGTGKVKE